MAISKEEALIEELKNIFKDKIKEAKIQRSRRIFITVPKEYYKEIIEYFAKNKGVTHISTITGVDVGKEIEILPHLFGVGMEITIKTSVPKDNPELDSLADIYPASIIYEREVHDLLGVKFKGNPNLTRILLPDNWPEGVYPLRKDFKVERKSG